LAGGDVPWARSIVDRGCAWRQHLFDVACVKSPTVSVSASAD
jgi:hypothetical protein